jgi:hypothetical protein
MSPLSSRRGLRTSLRQWGRRSRQSICICCGGSHPPSSMSVMEMRLVIEEVIAHSKRRCLGLQETAESCSQSFPLGSILTIWCEQADRLLSGKLCDPLSLSLTVYGLLRGLRCLEERLRTEQGSNGPLLIVLPSSQTPACAAPSSMSLCGALRQAPGSCHWQHHRGMAARCNGGRAGRRRAQVGTAGPGAVFRGPRAP